MDVSGYTNIKFTTARRNNRKHTIQWLWTSSAGTQTGSQNANEQQNHPLQQLGVRQSALGMTPMGSIQKTPVQRSGLNFGSLLGGLGSLASGLGGTAGLLCWVAREVYGIDNPRWLIFREWVVTESPRWFFKLYSTHGEAFAQWIADKPRIKHMIRTAMDVVVDRKIREARDVASLA